MNQELFTDAPEFIYIDLFCGAGGTTTGITMAVDEAGRLIAIVAACVNHDAKAIKSHWRNHPEVEHFEEDIRTLNLSRLKRLIDMYRAFYPNAKIVLWASLECTNFSKAKGGQPRDADSRTLAESLYMHYNTEDNSYTLGDSYIQLLDPDYIMIENVVEFMSWGPLDAKGKPVSRKNGQDWMRWRNEINALGYYDEWREMNSANFGAYTSRNRLFGCFAKKGLPIAWPEPTHGKKVNKGMFGNLQPWKAVKEVLDFTDEGESIFGRKKDLSPKTLERIFAGLLKFIAGGEQNYLAKIYAVASNSHGTYSTNSAAHTITTRDAHALIQPAFISKYNGGNAEFRNTSLNGPLGTIVTRNAHAYVNASFISKYFSGRPAGKVIPVTGPAGTITTAGTQSLVNASFLHAYYGNGNNNSDVNGPSPTLTTKDRLTLVKTHFINRDFTTSGHHQSIEKPAGSLLGIPKMNLVQVDARPFIMGTNYDNKPTSIDSPAPTITANRKWSYLVNPSWGGNPGSTDAPCPVVVARQDKAPLYMVMAEQGELKQRLIIGRTVIATQIKYFMAVYGIVDIKMRMLKVPELLKIQGFPADYILEGNQSDQKKFIGNSVVPHVVKAWVEAMYGKTRFIKLNPLPVQEAA